MNKGIDKLKQESGFSLMELMAATIILMLSTLIITQALDLAYKQFRAQTEEAEAQMLCSSLATAVQDELTYAIFDEKATGGNPAYFSMSRGMGNGCRIDSDTEGKLCIIKDGSNDKFPLVGPSSYTREGTDNQIFKATVVYSAPVDGIIKNVTIEVLGNDSDKLFSKTQFDVRTSSGLTKSRP